MNRTTLARALRDHVPADAREAGHRDRMFALLEVSGDPFHRSHLVPGHFTASAFVLSPDGAEVVLIDHAFLGIRVQPGGHVEPEDADIVAAAVREAREETGLVELDLLSAIHDLDIHAIPDNPRKGEGPHEHFDVRVLLRARTRELGAGAHWVRIDQVEDAGTDDSVLRAIRKL